MESERIRALVAALRSRDTDKVGKLLYESHRSLRDDFEVSCREIDNLIEVLSGIADIVGVRLTCAGFGGSIVTLVRTEAASSVDDDVRRYEYTAGTHGKAEFRFFLSR